MPKSVRLAAQQVDQILRKLAVVGNKGQSSIDFRRNILGDYSAAFDPEHLQDAFLEQIRTQLLQEIIDEMKKDPRTARLADGVRGAQISEKRGGNWRKVPRPRIQTTKTKSKSVAKGRAPIQINIYQVGENEARLSVRLTDPLYIIMHSGSRPHFIPPVGRMHVFPTSEAIARYGPYKESRYNLTRLEAIPWYDPQNKTVPFKKVSLKPIPPTAGYGKRHGRTGDTGFRHPKPFVTEPWRRVIRRNKRRLKKVITQRMRGNLGVPAGGPG